jgi:hypothetical protein
MPTMLIIKTNGAKKALESKKKTNRIAQKAKTTQF